MKTKIELDEWERRLLIHCMNRSRFIQDHPEHTVRWNDLYQKLRVSTPVTESYRKPKTSVRSKKTP